MAGRCGLFTRCGVCYLFAMMIGIGVTTTAFGQVTPPPPPTPNGTATNTSVGDTKFAGKAQCSGTAVPDANSQVDGVTYTIGTINGNGVFVPLVGAGMSAAGVPGPGNSYTVTLAGVPGGNYTVQMSARWRPKAGVAPVVTAQPVYQPVTVK